MQCTTESPRDNPLKPTLYSLYSTLLRVQTTLLHSLCSALLQRGDHCFRRAYSALHQALAVSPEQCTAGVLISGQRVGVSQHGSATLAQIFYQFISRLSKPTSCSVLLLLVQHEISSPAFVRKKRERKITSVFNSCCFFSLHKKVNIFYYTEPKKVFFFTWLK